MKNTYEIRGDVTAIFIKYKNEIKEAIISTNQLPIADAFFGTWFAKRHKKSDIYYVQGDIMVNWKKTRFMLHRYILDAKKGQVVDHINHNTLDNRESNLRVVSHAQNHQNRLEVQSNCTSGYRGVCWDKIHQRWIAHLKIDGKQIRFGTYKTKEEAVVAIQQARKKYMPYSQEALAN